MTTFAAQTGQTTPGTPEIMKNIIKYNGYTIWRWVAVFACDDIIGEHDSMIEARKAMKNVSGVCFKYAAAEQINSDGDLNPAVYGETLSEVTNRLKEILK